MQLIGVLHALVTMAEGPLFLRLIPSFFLILYLALFSGLWFFANMLATMLCPHVFFKTFIFLITYWLYIYFMDQWCFFPFGRSEGCFIVHPLLPLAQKPQLLQLLNLLGKSLCTLLILLVPASLALLIQTKTAIAWTLFCSASLVWILVYIHPLPKHKNPAWLDAIVSLPALFPNDASLQTAGYWELKHIIKKLPNVHIVIAPESACYADLKAVHTLNTWQHKELGKKMHVLFGAFSTKNSNHYNTLYWFYDGTLQGTFDKRHAVPLTERIPAWFDVPLIHNLYFSKQAPLKASNNARPQFTLSEKITIVPYICSELFCNEYPDDSYVTTPILALCNDSWFTFTYVHQLLYLAARLKAIQWQRSILYISYRYAVFFDATGNEQIIT